MFKLLYDPVSEIKKTKKQSYARILMYLLAASLFETIGILFFALKYLQDIVTTSQLINGTIALLFGLITAHLIAAFFYSFAMHVLDGKGGYYEGLATLVLGMVTPGIATFFAGAASYLPYGIIGSSIILTYGYILGAATLFRAGKELFELDYAGVLIGFLITAIPLGLASAGISFLL